MEVRSLSAQQYPPASDICPSLQVLQVQEPGQLAVVTVLLASGQPREREAMRR